MNPPVVLRAHADLALSVYLEPLAENARVLLLGDVQGVLAERIGAAAQKLELIDPALREPSPGPVPELPFDDGYFDLVVVSDVSSLPDPRSHAVIELRRVLSDQGVLVLSTQAREKKRRRGAPPEAMLERLLSAQFRYVRVLGAAPLSGWSLGELDGSRRDEFSVDSSLVRGEDERFERYVGFASDARVRLEPRLWVQVPAEPRATGDDDEGGAYELLRRLEDEAREASQREVELLRALETERKARADAEHKAERARALERRLRDAEGDYDDAVGRVRFLERELAEREAATASERGRREGVERDIAQSKAEVLAAEARVHAAEAERDAQKGDSEALVAENGELEKRLVERAEQIAELTREKKRHETLARDLLEELRRLEHHKSEAVEHDARVAELEAERDRAVQRALDAEVTREAAQMRADELRAQLGSAGPARAALDAEIEGTLLGLRLRVVELEQELASARRPRGRDELEKVMAERDALRDELDLLLVERSRTVAPPSPPPPPAPQHDHHAARGERAGLMLRLAEAEKALAASRHARPAPDVSALLAAERERHDEELERLRSEVERLIGELEATQGHLDTSERRAREIERELEEADRVAESHAEDESRIERLEIEVEAARRRLDEVEDDLRATEDALRLSRVEAESAGLEASARIELAQRRESEARAERDAARAALEEARATLAQLAGASAIEPAVRGIETETPETD